MNNRIAQTAELRAVNRGQRTIDVVASTFDIDSYGTRIDPKGWVLDKFLKNPVITWAHDDRGFTASGGRPIARGENVRVEDGMLKMRLRFPDKGKFLFADECFELMADGFLNAVSVGFNPLTEPEMVDEDGVQVPVYRSQELLELAVVTVPSNSEALAERAKRMNADPEEVRRRAQRLEAMAAETDGETDPIRWNRSLGRAFDVAGEKIAPSQLVFDWVAKHIGCEVKEVFRNSFIIPYFRFGGVLSGMKQAAVAGDLTDVRNLTWQGTEEPPVYNVIQLNSQRSDDFLVDGVAFYKAPGGNFAYRITPVWEGLYVEFFTHRKAKEDNRRMVDDAWRFARENNPLKGEAFALSGEFISRSDESWEDCFLEEKNQKAMTRIVERVNDKGKATPNRGVIMMGPPGTGKTLSGRIIRNTLKDASFIWVSTRDFHRGGGFTQAFELAREIAPSVLFFEDIDNWVGGNIDLLKTELDGIARSTGVVTIMTTNFPEQLPEALLDRPGRFHDVLNFNLPTEEKRGAMLRKWVEGLTDADIEDAVTKTKGYSGAHMYELASFARNLMESDDLGVSAALTEALKKVEEQKDLITKVQLGGSNYRPRRSHGMRVEQNPGTLVPDMEQQTIKVRVMDLPKGAELREKVAGIAEDYEKYKSYFDKKQPANKAATGVLKRFFDARDEQQPADEVAAWTRMAELLADSVKPEERKPENPAPNTPTTTDRAPEAPVRQEAPVRSISVSDLQALPAAFADHVLTAVRESLERGEAQKFVPQVAGKAGKEFLTSFFTQKS